MNATPTTPEQSNEPNQPTPSSKDNEFATDMSPELQQKMEELKPLRFARFIVRCPCLLCVMLLVLLAIISYIDVTFFVYTSDANRMYLVENSEWTIKMDALVLAQEHIAAAAATNESVTPQTQLEGFWSYQLMFKLDDPSADNHWILTPENIETIIEYENKIYLSSAWQNEFCFVTENETRNHYNFSCSSSIQSIARDIAILYDYNYTAMRTADIKEYVLARVTNPYYSILFNPDINKTKQSTIYRSILHAALPIATGSDDAGNHISSYKNAEDRYVEQEEIYGDWAQKFWTEITVDTNAKFKDGNLKILALSYVVFVEYFISLLSEAMFYVVFSILAVLVYMTIHLRSFMLSFAALIMILMSFPLAFLFYRLIFQITHFDTFSSLIIFVLLGVGADGVFVFTDAWSQSVHFIKKVDGKENMLLQRMSFAYSRASKAMFITQITTFFAFMATATSLIMPISAFGIWAGTVVSMNYVLVITMYPCILILHEKYFKKYENMICCCICNVFKKEKSTEPVEGSAADSVANYRAIERFFGGKFTDFILKSKVYILLFFVIVYVLCTFAALQIEPNKGDEVWFEDDHFMTVVADETSAFTAGETDGLFTVFVVWGVSGVDRAGTSKWDSTDYGVVQWDDTFDISSVEAQLFIRDTCNDLKDSPLSFSDEVVVCFTDYFEAYLSSKNMTFPVSVSDDAAEQKLLFAEIMYEFLHYSDYGGYIRDYGLAYVEEEGNGAYSLKFVAIQLFSDVSWDAPNDVVVAEFDAWNAWLEQVKESCGGEEGYCSPYHVTWAWADFVVRDAFVSSAVQGVVIAMPLALIVLLISTQNWIISVFAVLDIIGIMLCELGLMWAMGWQFGISEAISTVMIIGFSVDYVVHLANAYLECSDEFDLRKDRLRFSLLTMGISVCSGAITTFSAGFFLMFPVIVFFSKMGILMMSTIAFSIVFAMFFFTALLAQFGPQYDSGNICCCFKKKTKENNNNNINDGDIEMQ